MKKTVTFLVIILVVVGIIAIKNSHDKKVAKEQQREAEYRERAERAEVDRKAEADRKEYKTLLEIIAEYASLEKGLTTEAILSAKPREKYAKELLGSEINLYVILYDIKQENSRRVIDFWGEVRPREKYNPQDIIFKFYDDKKIITDVTKGTRLDIKAKVTRAVLRGDIMYMDFEIIGLITDYSKYSHYFSTLYSNASYVKLNDGRDIIVDTRLDRRSYEQGMRW